MPVTPNEDQVGRCFVCEGEVRDTTCLCDVHADRLKEIRELEVIERAESTPGHVLIEEGMGVGWDVFNSSERGLEVQRDDEDDLFDGDFEAAAHAYGLLLRATYAAALMGPRAGREASMAAAHARGEV